MLRPDDPWFLDEAVDEAGELLKALPEIRQYVVPAPPDEELGLRALLKQPDSFAHGWWREQASKSGGTSAAELRPPRPRAA
jgi:hypothetical protein